VCGSVNGKNALMNHRALAVFLIVCMGLVLVAGEAFARGAGGHGGGGHGGGGRHAGSRPFVRSQQVPAFYPAAPRAGHGTRAHVRPFHRDLRRARGPVFAFPAPGFVAYGASDDDEPALARVPAGEPVTLNGRPCFVQRYVVPSEAGGSRPVSVARCY
jgi:hypothetical protein